MAKVDGKEVVVGNWVCFKSGYERSGKIVAINGPSLLVAYEDEEYDEEYDEYLSCGETSAWVDADRCWLEWA